MAFNTYGELKSGIALWLNRKDLTEHIPAFIKLAETKMFREIRSPANEISVVYKTGTGDTTIILPADMLELKLFLINNQEYKYVSPNTFYGKTIPHNSELDSEDTVFNALSGTRVFTRIRNVLVLPDPLKGDEEIVLHYYSDFSGMNDDEDFNSVLRIAPDVYLYGALVEAEPFIKNDERMPMWKAMYDESLFKFKRYNNTLDWSANTPQIEGAY